MTIRSWSREDAEVLRPMLREFLRETYATGADFLPSDQNVETFLALGLSAANDGDPALLGLEGDRPVGFILWIGSPESHLEQRDTICLGMGTYVIPERRRSGVGRELREAGHARARLQGYTRIDGVGYYDAPKRLMESNGWKHAACVYQKEL